MFGTTFQPGGSEGKFPLPAHGLGVGIAAGGTMYAPFFWYGLTAGAGSLLIAIAGKVNNMVFSLNTNQPASGSLVATLMQTPISTGIEVATSLAITIPAGSLGPQVFINSVNSVVVSFGDYLRIRITNNAAAISGLIGPIGCQSNY